MLQNATVTAFTVSELLRENQQGLMILQFPSSILICHYHQNIRCVHF